MTDEEIFIPQLVVAGAGITLMIKEEADPLENENRIAVWTRKTASLALSFSHTKK